MLIGGLPTGERDLTGVVIRRQQVLLLAGSVHPVHVPPSVDEALGPNCTQGVCRGFVTADVLEKGLSRGAIATG